MSHQQISSGRHGRRIDRVLHVCIGYPPATAWGGTTTAAASAAAGLAAAGLEVTVATSNLESKGEKHDLVRSQIDNVDVHFLDCHSSSRWPGTVGPLAPTRASLTRLSALVRDTQLVHIHGNRQGLGLAAASLAVKHKTPFVLQPHGGVQQIMRKQRSKLLMDQTVGRLLLGKAAAVIALTDAEVAQISRFTDTPVRLVPNGVPPNDTQWLGQNKPPAILYVGRLNHKKGIDLLVDALAHEPLSNRSSVSLTIVGSDDGAEPELRSLVAKHGLGSRVDFAGFCEPSETIRLMSSADCVVVPSRTDTFPMVIGEASSIGVPLVVSSGCEIGDALSLAGVAVCDPTPTDLASTIDLLLENPNAFSAASDRLFEGTFSQRLSVERMIETYEECADDLG